MINLRACKAVTKMEKIKSSLMETQKQQSPLAIVQEIKSKNFLEIRLEKKSNLLCGVIYISPSHHNHYAVQELLRTVSAKENFSRLLIMGDFNYPEMNRDELKVLVSPHSLSVLYLSNSGLWRLRTHRIKIFFRSTQSLLIEQTTNTAETHPANIFGNECKRRSIACCMMHA